jgi:hypothetical protein
MIRSDDGSTVRLDSLGMDPTITTLSASKGRATPAVDEAVEFLHEVLADGPMAVSEVKVLATDAGISERSLRRAQKHLGIKPRRQSIGFAGGGEWYWELPPAQQADPPSQVVPPLWVE